ncbi:DUF7344 domain-containing protein [Halobacterium zhouii]|uniref:DUF7344 domain-containing protein n=1 Tax=Halobacterium zhouii TaxID=2902624 RepID=UPI001E2CB79F|nr:hypothetical protein [Halobacterium zhouii]
MSETDNADLSQNADLYLLSNPRRRFILSYLRRAGEPVDLVDLADEIAAWENDTEVEDLTSQQRKRVYVSIYQTHVPKLANAGVVTHDQDSGLVALSDDASEIDRHLQSEEEPRMWQFVYLSIAAFGGLLYLAILFELPVFSLIPLAAAGVLVVLLFGIAAITHFVYERYVSRRPPTDLIDER